MVFVQHGVVAVVDDDAKPGRGADGFDMGRKTVLLGVDQIGRQQQQSIGARLLRRDRDLPGDRRSVSGAGQNRHAALGFFDGDA